MQLVHIRITHAVASQLFDDALSCRRMAWHLLRLKLPCHKVHDQMHPDLQLQRAIPCHASRVCLGQLIELGSHLGMFLGSLLLSGIREKLPCCVILLKVLIGSVVQILRFEIVVPSAIVRAHLPAFSFIIPHNKGATLAVEFGHFQQILEEHLLTNSEGAGILRRVRPKHDFEQLLPFIHGTCQSAKSSRYATFSTILAQIRSLSLNLIHHSFQVLSHSPSLAHAPRQTRSRRRHLQYEISALLLILQVLQRVLLCVRVRLQKHVLHGGCH